MVLLKVAGAVNVSLSIASQNPSLFTGTCPKFPSKECRGDLKSSGMLRALTSFEKEMKMDAMQKSWSSKENREVFEKSKEVEESF